MLNDLPVGQLEWYRKRHYIADALEYTGGGTTLDDVEDRLAQGYAAFFWGDACAMVVELFERPSGDYAHIWLAGGDLDELLELEQDVASWARSLGCKFLTISGRKGWARALNDRYKVVGEQTLLKRDLADE
jgi:hypothetical protein